MEHTGEGRTFPQIRSSFWDRLWGKKDEEEEHMDRLSTGRSPRARIASVLGNRTIAPLVTLLLALICSSAVPTAIAGDDPVALAPPLFNVKRGFYSSPF
jgi:hypothetical protein